MEPIPLPSPIHYELILQLLERQTMTSLGQNEDLRNQVNQLEESFQSSSLIIDHRWSINHFGDKVDCS
jgi:hypothetical protein